MEKANISKKPGIYIHVPYCDTKCGYCDFYSITRHDTRSRFIRALLTEVEIYARLPYSNRSFDTIYFGGGTPSLLTAQELETILNALNRRFNISPGCEITLEANPGTLNPQKARQFKTLGINRISMGIQSFDDDELKTLGRIHNARQARQAFGDLRKAGFENISIDLIFALPGQTAGRWKNNLEQAVKLQPEHISAYSLIYEKGTAFYKKQQQGIFHAFSDEQELDFYTTALETLRQAGYIRYEISSYARDPGLYSRHNYKYWNHAPFLGFGPSAFSYFQEKRWGNVRSIRNYIKTLEQRQSPVDFMETLDRPTLSFEKIMLGLRTREGLNLAEFESCAGRGFLQSYPQKTQALLDDELARIDGQFFHFTDRGFMMCDEILPAFAPG